MDILESRSWRSSTYFLTCLTVWISAGSWAKAEEPTGGLVSTSGTAEVRKFPSILRVQIELTTRGKDLKQALENAKTRKAEVLATLQKMKAEAIEFGEVAKAEETENSKQIEAMFRKKIRGGAEKGPKIAALYELVRTVRFEFPLKVDSIEDLLLKAEAIQADVAKAELGHVESTAKSPEEQEVEEEINMFVRQRGVQQESKPGDPKFLFISAISETERKKAVADAFTAAQEKAKFLASANRFELGPLSSIQSKEDNGDASNIVRGYGYAGYAQAERHAAMVKDHEVWNSRPAQVVFRVHIETTHRLIKK